MNDTQGRHNAILENRQRLQLSGVTDVDSFDEDEIRLFTQLGELTIKGKDLHINEISVESGDVSVGFGLWRKGQKEKALGDREDIQITYVRATLGHPLADRYLWSVYPHFCCIAINRKNCEQAGERCSPLQVGGVYSGGF